MTETVPLALAAYANQLQDIDRRITARHHPERIPGFLNSGSNYHAYLLRDNQVIGKLPHVSRCRNPEQTITDSAEALKRGLGSLGLEQLVAHFEGEPLSLVTKYVKASPVQEIPYRRLQNITVPRFRRLLGSFRAMQDKGLGLGASENILYNPDTGFTIVDYCINETQSLEEKLLLFSSTFIHGTSKRPMPRYGQIYLEMCSQFFGSSVGALLSEHWSESIVEGPNTSMRGFL